MGDLIHWRDYQNPDAQEIKVPYGSMPATYSEPIRDNFSGEFYQLRVSPRGGRVRTRFQTTRYINGVKTRIEELAYTDDQYKLIGWALQKLDEDWTCRQVWEELRSSWVVEPGQVPPVSRTVHQWRMRRASMANKGLEWP